MKKIFLLILLAVAVVQPLVASGNWSTQKNATSKSLTVCYQASLTMYCAQSSKKGVKERDLKQFLSVYMQFSDKKIVKSEMVIHPGIKRLIRSSRSNEGARILKGVYDFLIREAKRKKIEISTGSGKTSQKVFSADEQTAHIQLIQWPKFISATIENILCPTSEKITFSLVITNSMKREFALTRDDVEIQLFNDTRQLFTVGTIEQNKIVVKAGTTESFPITIDRTGDMHPSMNYLLIPIIKKVKVSKKKFPIRCK